MPGTPTSQPFGRCTAAFAVALVALFCQLAPAQRGEDVGAVYLNAYMMADEAKGLEDGGQFGAALRKYNDASNILETIARNHPTWRSEVVTYRRRKVNEAIARCQAQVPGAQAGVAKGYGSTPRETYVPPPSVGGSTSQTLLGQKDAEIDRLKSTSEDLLRRLQSSQAELEKTKVDLNVSRNAQESLRVQLSKTKTLLADSAGDAEKAQKLESEIERLNNELQIANDSLAKADKRNEKLQEEIAQAGDMVSSIRTEREELEKERAQLDEMLKSAKDSDIKRLYTENLDLKKQLNQALSDVKRLTGEKEKDAEQIADLQDRLAKVEGRLAELQAENADYREQVASLSEKLRKTQDNLTRALSGPGGQASVAEEALQENEVLRNIVQRQITQHEWRKQGKELILEQIAKTGSLSREVVDQIERLAGGGAVLTPEEMAMFKGSLLPAGSDGVILDGNAPPPQYPELLGHNDGPRSASGLNDNLTEYAHAIISDFARGNYPACEAGYGRILEIVPDNVYALRNLGIVKMRMGKNSEAENYLRQAVATDSSDGYSHFLLGVLYYRADDYQKAMAAMERGLQTDPRNARAHHYVGAMCIERAMEQGVPAELQRDMRELARHEFQNVIEIDPEFGDAYYNLAYLYVTDQPPRLDLARQYYQKAQRNGTPPDAAMDRALGT